MDGLHFSFPWAQATIRHQSEKPASYLDGCDLRHVVGVHSVAMSDETYSLIMALSALAYAVVLWLHFRRGRILRKLKRQLEEQGYKLDPPEPPTPDNR